MNVKRTFYKETEIAGRKEYNSIGELKKKLSIKFAGWFSIFDNTFHVGFNADFRTSTKRNSYGTYYKIFGEGGAYMNSFYDHENNGLSVRLVKDS